MAVTEADRLAKQDQNLQDLNRRVSELERREQLRSSPTTPSATATRRVSPPRNNTVKEQVTVPRRSRRRGARPIIEHFVIGDEVILLDQKQ